MVGDDVAECICRTDGWYHSLSEIHRVQALRLILVNPPPLAIIEPWYDEPNWGRSALAYLATYLRENSDVEISIIDAKLERLNFQQVRDRICDQKPDVVGLTAFTNEVKPAAYLGCPDQRTVAVDSDSDRWRACYRTAKTDIG